MARISIIVAVYNKIQTLQQCLDSIKNQVNCDIELIVIDGGSTDGSVELLAFNHSAINYWISEPDNGVYSAWNKGIKQATGQWICFLGADDFLWSPTAICTIDAALKKAATNISLVYGQIIVLGKDDAPLYTLGEPWCQKLRERFNQEMAIPHPGLMHRGDLFEKYGYFDESLKIAGDYEFLLRVLKCEEALFTPGVLTVAMRTGGVSSDSSNALQMVREVWFAKRKNGVFPLGIRSMLAITRAFLRALILRLVGDQLARRLLDFGRKIAGLPPFWTKS